MPQKPYTVYVIQGRGQGDYSDCQDALAHVPARVTTLPFIADEAAVIERTRDADGLVVVASPVTRPVLSALEGLKVVVRTGVGDDVIDVPAATELGVVVVLVNTEVYGAGHRRRLLGPARPVPHPRQLGADPPGREPRPTGS